MFASGRPAAAQALPTCFGLPANIIGIGTTINGTSGNDVMRGGTENDVLFGDDGDDELFGQFGRDDLNGGNGLDRCSGGLGSDTEVLCEQS